MGPGGELLLNRGQITPQVVVQNGSLGRINFAEADVRKPLLAVSDCNKKGNPVWFDDDRSCIIPAGALELPEVRKLIAAIEKKIQLHPTNGTYAMRTWEQPEGPFQGPGW